LLRQGFRHFWGVDARWCGGLLHRILQRYCTEFCSAYLAGSQLEVVVGDLQVVLRRDHLRVADPGADDVNGFCTFLPSAKRVNVQAKGVVA
jgi:hypothetical protein